MEAAKSRRGGYGFSRVVAEEVRNLAQRSAQAAKDTAGLIEDSISKSGEGSRKLAQVAASIEAITDGAGKVKVLVDEVEVSSKEQAQGIEQISKAVAQMDQVTQKTAASAEESASASEQLSAQSQALMAVVRQLQVVVGGVSTPPVASTAGRKTTSAPRRPAPNAFRRSVGAAAAPRVKTSAGAGSRTVAEFPLDESEFREF